MNRSVWLRWGTTAALPVAMALWGAGGAHAEIVDPEPSFSLKLATALRERTFMRLGVVSVNVKTTSGDAYDVTGPVIKKGDVLQTLRNYPVLLAPVPAAERTYRNQLRSGITLSGNALDRRLTELGWDGLGSPVGVKARAEDDLYTPVISIGHYLSDDFTWMVEAYVLASPLKSRIYGDGVNAMNQPNGVAGKHILNTKILPPVLQVGRYWGDKSAKFRPYTGVMGMYAIFFDSEATSALNEYMGGSSPGDTTVSVKNAFGIGPAVGFKFQIDDRWHASFNVGSVKLKTQATLTTRNTVIRSGSAVLNDYPVQIQQAIFVAENAVASTYPRQFGPSQGGAVTALMRLVSQDRGLANDSLGTYVRKQNTTLDSTILMFSVGRTF